MSQNAFKQKAIKTNQLIPKWHIKTMPIIFSSLPYKPLEEIPLNPLHFQDRDRDSPQRHFVSVGLKSGLRNWVKINPSKIDSSSYTWLVNVVSDIF